VSAAATDGKPHTLAEILKKMHRFTYLLLLILTISANCQTSIDKIIITRNLYVNRFNDADSLYRSDVKIITNKNKISQLIDALKITENKENLLAIFEIDTNYIKNNGEKLLNLYSGKEIVWNTKQKQYIFNELTNNNNYKKELEKYLSNGCCYTMHNSYKYEYIVDFIVDSNSSSRYKSRRHVWGYKFPWKDEKGKFIYNYQVDILIDKIFEQKAKIEKPLKGNELLKLLVNKIIENNSKTLYKLSAYSYISEIEELKTDFKIISFEEVYARGRYIWDEDKVMQVKLHNDKMLPNVNIQFLAKIENGKLYSRDSIINEYPKIINRIQNINFLREYLIKNKNSRLDIYYFNNNSITDYTIDEINKSENEWKNYDSYIESLKYYQKNNIKPNFDIEEAIETSKRVNCGCNYRFENSYLQQSIFFELFGEDDDSSIWVLLPDNKLLLYIMDDDKVINLNLKGYESKHGVKFPCKLFDQNGKELKI
jgi:hypothetical protein